MFGVVSRDEIQRLEAIKTDLQTRVEEAVRVMRFSFLKKSHQFSHLNYLSIIFCLTFYIWSLCCTFLFIIGQRQRPFA